MTSKEMKLVKFETIIGGIWKKLDGCYLNVNSFNPLVLLFGDEWNNEYANVVRKNTFINNIPSGSQIANDVSQLIAICKSYEDGWDYENPGAQIVFFGLIILAIDSDSYNEKLNIITDFAYLVGFDEYMINDWIYAVRAVLSAEKIDLEKMKSDNSMNFFVMLA